MLLGTSRTLSATLHLLNVSVRRLLFSRSTMISLVLLCFAAVAVIAWSIRRERETVDFVEQVFLTIYVSFLLPVFCLSYATAGIASEVEDRSLVYVLVTPLPRPCVFAAKSLASYLLALLWTMGGFAMLCWLAGDPGWSAFERLRHAVVWSTCAYVALFQLFSVSLKRATILALAYALFLETLIGNMPGIVKRLAVSFYTRCLVFNAMSDLPLDRSGLYDPALFLPVSTETAQVVLLAATGALIVAGALVFTFREYSR